MAWFSSSDDLSPSHLVNGFPWSGLKAGGTVVDIGGGAGTYAKALAEAFPTLNLIVQDKAEVVDGGSSASLERERGKGERHADDVSERLVYMAHDFFQLQPIMDADVYLLRWILHDWPDGAAVKILRAIVPSL